MASTGRDAWNKYFKGANVPTNMKKDSAGYDPEKPNKIIQSKISAGEEIIAMNGPFDAKYLVQRKKDGKFYRVTFNNIQKPGKVRRVNLKPQEFGIVDKDFTIKEYTKLLLTNIGDSKLTPEIKSYLEALVLYYDKQVPLSYVRNLYNPNLPINEIKKDFGEILGPIAIIKDGLLKNKGINIPPTSKVFFPSRPNEPLLDYVIKAPRQSYSISAKSGTTTNVVKPMDIINLLKLDPKKVSKWKRSPEYSILENLAGNGIVDGAISAAAALGEGPSEAFAEDVRRRLSSGSYSDYNYDDNLAQPFINSNDYLSQKERPTLNEIMYESEKVVAKASKQLKFNQIFKDAIENKVIYVKFDIIGGTPKFSSLVSDDFSSNKVFLRTKNGYTRRSDRMGVQT